MHTFQTKISLFFFLYFFAGYARAQEMVLANDQVKILWEEDEGWKIRTLALKSGKQWKEIDYPSGEYTLLRTAEKPDDNAPQDYYTITGQSFPGTIYKYIVNTWNKRTNAVSLNTAGQAYHFYPDKVEKLGENQLLFQKDTDWGVVKVLWSLDPEYPNDVQIRQSMEVSKAGFYSLASPSVATVPAKSLEWATVPGYFHGNRLQENLVLSYAYGNGVPARPIVFSEKTASTLSPIISSNKGFTMAVIPAPGLGRDPWKTDENTHQQWNLGLSHMNRKSQLTPTLYYPVLGETNSAIQKGKEISFEYRISLQPTDWFHTMKHAAYDIFDFKQGLNLRENRQSLSFRVEAMHGYLTDPVTSLWRVETFNGREIGAQAYLGGVVGSDKDAMKNADYGAMWMLANATGDPKLKEDILPYALNFKLAQQQVEEGFFQGAAIGQYYLSKSNKFVEEWGEMVEPIALTYYIMLDMGNILLFEPDNLELKERLRLGADLLLEWQKQDGSWAVAYNREEEEIFQELKDFRPTFYGLLVAYRILGDEKYLSAAIKGANWYLENGVNQGSFLGVCGDLRYAPDFATGQTAQAYLDLYNFTGMGVFREAAVHAAKIYTSYIYTHPIPTQNTKVVKGKQLQDWEIAQAGLSFEHGGAIGSANMHGPILLASHAGMFIRMHAITGEQIFADMARSAAIGREAFVNPKTSVASYYWRAMDAGAGPYPHHAWWQVGWITDYLMAEVNLRSEGKISFPRGFITPKVGPHQSYGFEPGSIFGKTAHLKIVPNGLKISNPSFEHVIAVSDDKKQILVTLLNQHHQTQTGDLEMDLTKFNLTGKPKTVNLLDHQGIRKAALAVEGGWKLSVPPYGLAVVELNF